MADFKKEYKAAMDSITPDKELLEKIKEDMKAELDAPQKKLSFFVMHKTALSAAALVLTLGITVFAAVMLTSGVQNITSDSSGSPEFNNAGAKMNNAEGIVITIPEYDDNIYEPNGDAAKAEDNENAWIADDFSGTFATNDDRLSADADAPENAEAPAPSNISDSKSEADDIPAEEAENSVTVSNEEVFPESVTFDEENEKMLKTVSYSLLKEIAENADKYSFDFYTSLNTSVEWDVYYIVSLVYYGENSDYIITAYADSASGNTLPAAVVMARYESNGAVDAGNGIDLIANGYRLDDYLSGEFSEEIEQFAVATNIPLTY